MSTRRRVAIAVKFRTGDDPTTVLEATRYALRELARRYQQLTEQIARLDEQLDRLVGETAPELVTKMGVGTHTAPALLVPAGDNPERLAHEGSFARLTGSAPLDASSGKQQRHRLNRDANCALYQIALTRSSKHEDTKRYLERRMAEGKTKKGSLPLPQALHRPRSPSNARPHTRPTNRA